MSTLISQLPEEIRKKAELYRRRAKRDTDQLEWAFDWTGTKEGYHVWNAVFTGYYQPFTHFHYKSGLQNKVGEIIDRRLSRNETIDLLVKLWEEKH